MHTASLQTTCLNTSLVYTNHVVGSSPCVDALCKDDTMEFFVAFAPESPQAGPYRQSERGEIYKEMADKLVETGWAYPCFCTEEELIAKREQVGQLEGVPRS